MTLPTRTDALDVLIVDDDPQLASLVGTVLRYHDAERFNVRRETTAEAGLASYDRRPADVVVLDLGLPDATRADPLRVLRQLLSRHPRPCVVVLTSHPWGLGRDAVRMGAQDYLDKGQLSAGQLRDAVLFAVERHAHTLRNLPADALQAADQASSHPSQPGGAERLRTPLGTLTRALEQLRDDRELTPQQRQDVLDRALRGAYALGGQLDQVVAAQRRRVAREPVDLDALALEVAQGLGELADAVSASIEVEPLPEIWGQPQPMRLLLRNLLINALQHGGGGVQVVVSSQDHPRGVRLLVDDDGPGIDANLRSGLFEHQPDGAHTFGLRACAAVATAHGGRCWIEDSPLGGARVVVELPVRRRVAG